MKFTAENAAEMGRKSAEARRAREEMYRAAANIAVDDPNLDFTQATLARVRMQLDLVNKRLTEALERDRLDPGAIDRLASAQSRLSEQERILAGRPTPGSLKPATPRQSRTSVSAPSFSIPDPPAQQSQVPSQDSQALPGPGA